MSTVQLSLNAPSGAGCFLTRSRVSTLLTSRPSLNAPSGAGCFLTQDDQRVLEDDDQVLMHLLVLGAF